MIIRAREMPLKPFKTSFKFWLETEDGYLFGEGPFELLCKIRELETLRAASKALGMSYRHAWGIIKDVEKKLGAPILKTRKGGTRGGGGAELTEEGLSLVNEYFRLKEAYLQVSTALAAKKGSQALGLEGHVTGRILRVWRGRPVMIDVEIEGGSVGRFLLDETQLKEERMDEGQRLQFRLKDASLSIEKPLVPL
jgi:molybdate transport repressor ModE-like protein